MSEARVAALTEERLLHDEQRLVRGPVGIVAVEAVFARRRVFEEERPALFRMALDALVVRRIRGDEARRLGSVRVVAAGALHLLFAQRMVRRLHQRGSNLLMAFRAQLLLRRLLEQFLVSAMDRMTIHARQLALVVCAPVPQGRAAARVTLQADRVVLGRRHGGREGHQAADVAATAARDVIRRRTVTALASEAGPGSPGVTALAVRLIHVARELVVVALRTCFRADIGGARGCRRRRECARTIRISGCRWWGLR